MTETAQPTSDGDRRRTKYLRHAFAMNPMWQAKEVLQLRRKALGLSRAAGDDRTEDEAERRAKSQAIRQHIRQLQNHFWTMPLDQLQRSLREIDVQKMPELTPVVRRLRTAAACRGEFPKLAAAKGMDLPLFNAFRKIVVLPPSEAGYIREQFIQSLGDRNRVKDVRRAIRIIDSDYSILYGLERDWFATLQGLKRPRAAGEAGAQSGGGGFELPEISWVGWIVIFIAIRAVLRLIMSAGG